ncbi:hypothetical protein HDA40_006942 [Hamadaea flava]|uniref:SbcC/MukB-like Walker B domain-containing protein n=1 Tax=Hamadaea flava TaxID=1742688 RepID=A0ABV8M0K3_9ACTN|nr:SbcC/MukB-like Walker B domain-containing protein [Hamadaea flava]MCP2328435.1 hypothetical protein [Hamadaea flava]
MTSTDLLAILDDDNPAEPVGHAERFTTRWRLVGAGLSNVWRYGDLHLDAPSGRLLLRGPNGTGKTTALEALWPYLLDLNPQRLAAGKARPTTLSLLMREGANGAKRRCGYLWLTLAAPGNEGTFSYGVRLLFSESGSPAVRVTPFMVPGVPLRDVAFYGPNRGFLSADQFTEEIARVGGIVFDDEDAYVAHLATRIWAADERELLELANRVRAVRNPTLLGDVSPRAAAETLRDALPGVADDVVTATAEALAESEATREAFQRDRDAAVALDRFAEAWAGHVVEVVTGATATAKKALSDAKEAERQREKASKKLEDARQQRDEAESKFAELSQTARSLEATIRALETSEGYKAAGRLTAMQDAVSNDMRAASTSLTAFQTAVETATQRAAQLRESASDIEVDLEEMFAAAARIDGHARSDHPLLIVGTTPQDAFHIETVTIDPGPATQIAVDLERTDDLARSWKNLASDHRTRGDSAQLALADRRETDEAERQADDASDKARAARLQAEQQQRELARETSAARTAIQQLVDAIEDWYAEHEPLVSLVDDAVHDASSATNVDSSVWHLPETIASTRDEPAQALTEIDSLANAIKDSGQTAAVDLRHRAQIVRKAAAALREERNRLLTEARQLREGKLLPVPRPDWAGPLAEGAAFADAIDWHPTYTDSDGRARIELALAASGLLGAVLLPDGVHTEAWYVTATSHSSEPNLSSVLIADPAHPLSGAATRVLTAIPLRDTARVADTNSGLTVGRDGTFAAGPLHGRPAGVDDPARRPAAAYVGAAQRRAAALARAEELEAQAAILEGQADDQDSVARLHQLSAERIASAVRQFPDRSAATRAESTRAAAAILAGRLNTKATEASVRAAELGELAHDLRAEWTQRTLARGLPSDKAELGRLRDAEAEAAKKLDGLAKDLAARLRPRLQRLAGNAVNDRERNHALGGQHAETVAAARHAREVQTEYDALVMAVGLDAETALAQHARAKERRQGLAERLILAESTASDKRIEAQKIGFELNQAADRVESLVPLTAAAIRQLRGLVDVPGLAQALGGEAAIATPSDDDATDEAFVAAVSAALTGKRAINRRLLRERYDACRADLAGLWTLDPGDSYDSLDTYVLTHDGMSYTPPAAAEAGRRLRDRAQAALDKAEESALRDFVIGRLPLAIGTAWVGIEDWIKDVNRKMNKAAASSGVGVQVRKTLLKDLSAAELTVHRLACKETTLTSAQQIEVGEALQDLINAADGATTAEKLANAIDLRKWLDITYEIVRPGGQTSRWSSKTGLSGGERRLVVLAPMLAAVAAYYDQLDLAGLRLTALDEVPAEVDERGREGLARYLAELDLDLICTSYLWDGAPGAWDGIDAWDLEAGPDTTVVAFPMLVRGLSPLPGDSGEEPE